MVKLYIGVNNLTVVLYEEFSVFTRKVEENWEFERVVKCETNSKNSDDGAIECCAFSPCGKYFGVSCDKNIVIYETFHWDVLCKLPGERKASCLRFFPKSNVLLFANKSGFATFYSFDKNKLEKIDTSLGHNSMLTSALITDDEKYVVTCDRDEKIRISNYPNVYNIEQYCLGHTQFVTWIGFLPVDKKILVSCSGDGTVRFWNYLSGKELAQYDCKLTIKNNDINDQNKTVITKLAMCEVGSVSIIAISQYKSNSVKFIKVSGDLNNPLVIEAMSELSLPSVPWDISFCQDNLICLLPNKYQPVMIWSISQNKFVGDINFQNILKYFLQNINVILETSKKITDKIPVLFKREEDNLKEYEERKKARLLRTGKTS